MGRDGNSEWSFKVLVTCTFSLTSSSEHTSLDTAYYYRHYIVSPLKFRLLQLPLQHSLSIIIGIG